MSHITNTDARCTSQPTSRPTSQSSSPTLKNSSPTPHNQPPSRRPIRLLSEDPLSRFILFDGSQTPYIEPHSSGEAGLDADYDALVEARWHEHLAEHHLMDSGDDLHRHGSKNLVNTPIQLYLAHSRLARAQLEIGIYSKLLEQEIGQSLRKDFQRTMELSLPQEGLFHGHSTHRPILA